MKKTLVALSIISLALVISGCSKSSPKEKSPIAGQLSSFVKNRSEGMSQYGVSNVKNKQQNTSKIDCLVFNQAAKGSIPNTLGELSALDSSMKLRIQLGCADTSNALVDYETVRRVLKYTWENKLSQEPYSKQVLLKSSKMGHLISNQIDDVTSEDMVCWSERGRKARKRNWSSSIHKIEISCSTGASARRKDQCQNAWYVAYAHQKAQGSRDNLSYLAELVARYRMMFLSCSPQSTKEYVTYHKQVPKELYNGIAYRFRIAIDPIMACQLNEINNRLSKGYSINPENEWIVCSKKWGLQSLYSTELMPHMISSEMLQGKSSSHHGKWLFNPENASKEPQTWTFDSCDKKVIAYLQKNGLNLSSPYSIKRYCRIHGNN